MKNIESAIEETACRRDAMSTRPTARDRARSMFRDPNGKMVDAVTAAILAAERDVLAEVAARFPTFEPTGQEHNCCARCHEMVHVEFGKDWEDGDVCASCSDELYQSAKSFVADRIAALSSGIKGKR